MGQHKKCRSFRLSYQVVGSTKSMSRSFGQNQQVISRRPFHSSPKHRMDAFLVARRQTSVCGTSLRFIRPHSSHAYTASVRVIPPVAETIGSPAVDRPFCRPEPGGGCARFTVVRSDNNLATCRQTYIRVSYSCLLYTSPSPRD